MIQTEKSLKQKAISVKSDLSGKLDLTELNEYLEKGYTVEFVVPQSVSTVGGDYINTKYGEILVIIN
jgi:hypothetical protein